MSKEERTAKATAIIAKIVRECEGMSIRDVVLVLRDAEHIITSATTMSVDEALTKLAISAE